MLFMEGTSHYAVKGGGKRIEGGGRSPSWGVMWHLGVGGGAHQQGQKQSSKGRGMFMMPLTSGRRSRWGQPGGCRSWKRCRMAVRKRKSCARARLSPRHIRFPVVKREGGGSPRGVPVPSAGWGGLYVPPTCREGHEGFAFLETPLFIQKVTGVEGFRVFEVAGVLQG